MPEISLADLHETLCTWQNSLKGHQVQKSNTVICTWTSLAFQHWEVPQASQSTASKSCMVTFRQKRTIFFYAVSEILWDVVGIVPVVCFLLPPFQMLHMMSLWLWELRASHGCPMLLVPLKRVQEGTNSLSMNCLRKDFHLGATWICTCTVQSTVLEKYSYKMRSLSSFKIIINNS